ncbi:MAG: hypothetical protein HQM09_13010 [Candidatus Riflebacteria bacterium]|nr:hypothetical protein [Candidatus Riflebacteria bacterium]
MSTSFEFLPKQARRAAPERRLPIVFLVMALVASLGGLYLNGSLAETQAEYKRQTKEMETRRMELLAQARAMLPPANVLSDIVSSVDSQNTALIGQRTPWRALFQALEETLPSDAVVMKIENSKGNTPVFQAGELDFRVSVVVSDSDMAQTFYKKLCTKKAFQSLSFTPKGETTYQGRKGTGVELVFHFGESS